MSGLVTTFRECLAQTGRGNFPVERALCSRLQQYARSRRDAVNLQLMGQV